MAQGLLDDRDMAGQQMDAGSHEPGPAAEVIAIDRQRYRRVRNFFLKVTLHLIFWDILLNRPVFRLFRTSSTKRWQALSREYRQLAVSLGGVLIKLGQFLSVRVDILPPEVTAELEGLRDEIPAAPSAELIRQIEADYNRPINEMFTYFSAEPVGSASLGQVHAARLAGDGSRVVVKVLRPSIDVLVETDLAALGVALGWLKKYRQITRRVDLDWLLDEFSRVTRAELDFVGEGKNLERFGADFAADELVYVPRVYWNYTSKRTLTLEDVGYIKVGSLAEIKASGIDPAAVAKKIYNVYLTQIFTTHFVHADPHPGNIFIKPLPTEAERSQGVTDYGPGDQAPWTPNRQFQVVFVDFGMITVIPSRLRSALREYVIGVGTRDAYRIVQSYVHAGTLLPGADLRRLEEAHQALLDQFWGANAREIKSIMFGQGDELMREYRDIIYAAPFQFQADMLFTVRAVAILSGIATSLDETFDPWQEIIPFAEGVAAQELRLNWQHWLKEIVTLGQVLYRLPKSVEDVVTQAQRGNLRVNTSLTAENRNLLVQLEKSINRLAWIIASAGLLLSTIVLYGLSSPAWLSGGAGVLSVLVFTWGIWSNRR